MEFSYWLKKEWDTNSKDHWPEICWPELRKFGHKGFNRGRPIGLSRFGLGMESFFSVVCLIRWPELQKYRDDVVENNSDNQRQEREGTAERDAQFIEKCK